MMDDLFNQIFFKHVYIRNEIYYHVVNDANCKIVKYKYCYGASWLIRNRYFKLLKYKLKNGEYVLFDIYGRDYIFKIKDDIDLFVQCFENISHVYGFSASHRSPLPIAVANGNKDAFKYLVEKGYSVPNIDHQSLFLENAIKMVDIDIVQYFITNAKYIQTESVYYMVLDTNNIDLIKMVFDAPRRAQAKDVFTISHQRDKLLLHSMSTLDIEIFKLVLEHIKKLNLFSNKRNLLKDYGLFRPLFYISVCSYDTCKYMMDNFSVDLLKEYEIQRPTTHNPFINAAEHGQKLVIENILLKRFKLPDKQIQLQMALKALLNGHLNLYEFIQNTFNQPISPAPIDFSYFKMKDPPISLNKLEYIFETLKTTIVKGDLEVSSSLHSDTFIYLHQRSSNVELDYNSVDKIIYNAMQNNHLDIVLYLYQQGIDISRVYSHLSEIKTISFHSTQFVIKIFKLLPPNLTHSQNIIVLVHNYIRYSREFNLFKTLFDSISHLFIDNKTILNHCYTQAIRYGRLKVIQYCFENFYKPDVPTCVAYINTGALSGNLSVIKYILDSYDSTTNDTSTEKKENNLKLSISNNTNILFNTIGNNHLQCFKYLLPFYNNNFTNIPFVSLSELLGSQGNLPIIEYLYKIPIFKEKLKYDTILEQCQKNKFTDVYSYLINL